MKHILTIATLLLTTFCFAQKESAARRLGLRGGVNFNQVTQASSISTKSHQGFNAAAFFAPSHKGVIGYRTEISFSRQGYDFSKASTTGSVTLDYILMPQLTTINLTRFVQFQVGGQVGYLLNSSEEKDYFNKFTYGFAGGAEIYPIRRVFIGARINVPLNPMNVAQPSNPLIPAYIPKDKEELKNNVVLVYLGVQL